MVGNNVQNICPVCAATLSPSRICACGFGEQDKRQLLLVKRDRLLYMVYSMLSILLLLAVFQSYQWGPYAQEIPILKIKQAFGLLDQAGYLRIVDICTKREKVNCVEDAYRDLYLNKNNIEAVAELAQFEFKIHETDSAIRKFKTYYEKGGKNPKVPLQFALALEQKSEFELALKYLNLSIEQNPERLSAMATQEILKILMQQQKYAQAQRLILNFWASAENAKGYFNKEADQLQKILGHQARGARKVASSKSI